MNLSDIIRTISNNNNRKLQIGFLLVINTLLFVACALIFPIRFQTNDDVIMAWIANGVVTGTPDCHLVFMNAIYGCFLTFLYRIAPDLEWYSIIFSVIHIVAITIIIAFFYHKIQNKFIRWIVIGLYYLLWFRIIQFFQFTTTTSMLAFSGILLLYDRKYVCGGAILLISSVLRFEAMGLIGLLSIPLFLYLYKFEIKKYVPLVLILLLAGGLRFADRLFYQTDEWKEYLEYNYYRGVVNDSPNNWRLRSDDVSIGISKENLDLLLRCNADPCQISNAEIKNLAEFTFSTPFLQKCHNLPYSIKHYPFYKLYFAIFLLMFAIYLFLADGKRNKLFVLAAFMLFIGIIWYISLDGNIKQRIVESVSFVLFSYVLLLQDKNNNLSKNVVLSIFPLILSASVLFMLVKSCIRTEVTTSIDEQMQLIEKVRDNKIFNLTHHFQSELQSPFKLFEFSRRKFIPGGWLTKSPFVEIKSFREIVDSDIVFFVKKGWDISFFQNALLRNYNLETDICEVAESEHYIVVGLTSKKEE